MNIASTHRLIDYQELKSYSDLFIETGSGHGDGARIAAEAGFVVISIEAQKENYDICLERIKPLGLAIGFILGESVKVLARLLQTKTNGSSDAVFFLDAHVSGEASYGYQQWAAGDPLYTQDSIIRRELEIILSAPGTPVIAIDDVNGNADGLAEQYAEIIEKAKPGYSFFFYDENRGNEHLYTDKILVAFPPR